MQKIILGAITLLLITSANMTGSAQTTEKKEEEKPTTTTTTADAWRNAVPQNQQTVDTSTVVVTEESTDNVESKESAAETEKRIISLEQRLMEAIKQRDAVTLKSLLADDFMLAGVNIPGAQTDKTRYIDWTLKKLELKSYSLEKTTVRVYPSTVIVTTNYKRQAVIAGAPSDGDFIVTNVWVKRGKLWQAVSQHISQNSKP